MLKRRTSRPAIVVIDRIMTESASGFAKSDVNVQARLSAPLGRLDHVDRIERLKGIYGRIDRHRMGSAKNGAADADSGSMKRRQHLGDSKSSQRRVGVVKG